MRPALVWGWMRYPSRSRAAISLRTVAEETSTPGLPVMWDEPTGWAESMYSFTTALRMAALRSSSASSPPAVTCTSSPGAGRDPDLVVRLPALVLRGGTIVLALDSTECQRFHREPGAGLR